MRSRIASRSNGCPAALGAILVSAMNRKPLLSEVLLLLLVLQLILPPLLELSLTFAWRCLLL